MSKFILKYFVFSKFILAVLKESAKLKFQTKKLAQPAEAAEYNCMYSEG